MLEISRFLGIIIAMYFNDHNPPHFHVLYNEHKDVFMIKIIDAKLQKNFTVYVEFNDGKKGFIFFKKILEADHRQVIRDLLQEEIFNTLKVNLNTLCWDNGVDFAPDFLYQQVEIVA